MQNSWNKGTDYLYLAPFPSHPKTTIVNMLLYSLFLLIFLKYFFLKGIFDHGIVLDDE